MYWEYVIAGYSIVLGAIACYAALLIRRGRQLAQQVPADRRRFLGQ